MQTLIQLAVQILILLLSGLLIKLSGGSRQSKLDEHSGPPTLKDIEIAIRNSRIPNYAYVASLAIFVGMSVYVLWGSAVAILAGMTALWPGTRIPVESLLYIGIGFSLYATWMISSDYELVNGTV